MTDWRERNRTFFDALNVERNVMFVILTLIVLVAALNIISGLIMLVKDKSHDIAILRTMGATRGAIMRIFLITGGDRHQRDIGRVPAWSSRCRECRIDPPVPEPASAREFLSGGALFSFAASGDRRRP